jgi:hypothetical protein
METSMHKNPVIGSCVLGAVVLALPVLAHAETAHVTLGGYQEVPAISTTGSGSFRAKIDEAAGTIEWELQYSGLEADATQSHIHFGQADVNGGVSVFLCTNLGNGPAGTAACPLRSAVLTGVITSATIIGPAVQGISPGEFAELVAAIRGGVAYVNVHSTVWPAGEIRGQVK